MFVDVQSEQRLLVIAVVFQEMNQARHDSMLIVGIL